MSLAYSEIWREFRRSKLGIAGLIVLAALIAISIVAVATIPMETFQQWHNPAQWINNPKSAMPAWMNNFMAVKLPEHRIIKDPHVIESSQSGIRTVSHSFVFDHNYDKFLDDFMLNYAVQYHATPPLLQLYIDRPDGTKIEMLRTTLPTPYTGSYT
ncbi:MAG: ABC transporter permease, partial [Nitrososphaerales archaeon]